MNNTTVVIVLMCKHFRVFKLVHNMWQTMCTLAEETHIG